MSDVLAAIRELHRPVEVFWLCCDGCDSEGFEAETPRWPCRTARLVYTAEEIEEVAQRTRETRAARTETADSSPTARLIPALWGQQLAAQIRDSEWIMRALNTPPEHR